MEKLKGGKKSKKFKYIYYLWEVYSNSLKMNCRVGCWRSDSNNDDTLTSSRQISFSSGHRCCLLDTKLLRKGRCRRSDSHRAVCLSFLYRRRHLDCRSSRSEIFKIYCHNQVLLIICGIYHHKHLDQLVIE